MVHTPKAPDPTTTAQAQAQYNQNTAITQQLLNMTNQVTPYGTLTYGQTGNSTFTGADGKQYTVPQFTQQTTLNPEQQATLNATQGASNNIANTAQSLSGSGLSSLSQAVDTSGSPLLQTSLNGYKTSLGDSYKTSFGGDVSQAYNDAKNAVMDQYTPTLDRNAEQSRAQMVASGIRPGSAAYSANEQTIGDNYTRAADQATQTAQSVQSQLFNQQAQQAQFTDNALTNQMQSENSAALQQAQFGNDARSQWLQQYYQQRDQPLNELSALLSGAQVNNATTGATSTPQTNVAGTNYSGLVENNYQSQLAQSQGMMSGLFGLAGGASYLGGSYLGSK